MKKIIISGGNGFLGSFLVEKALKENMDVTVVDDMSTSKEINVQKEKKKVTKQILEKYYFLGKPLLGVEKVKKEKLKDYGIIDSERIDQELWKVKSLMEKTEPIEAPSDLGIDGLYILDYKIFEYLRKIKPGKNSKFQLTDALNLYVKENELFATTFNGKRYDISTKVLWLESFVEFLKSDNRFTGIFKKRESDANRKF
ncbi:MAG: NAD-dependent epimerase/dehydratase family protein [Candidatus Micrarchaeia archaeon]